MFYIFVETSIKTITTIYSREDKTMNNKKNTKKSLSFLPKTSTTKRRSNTSGYPVERNISTGEDLFYCDPNEKIASERAYQEYLQSIVKVEKNSDDETVCSSNKRVRSESVPSYEESINEVVCLYTSSVIQTTSSKVIVSSGASISNQDSMLKVVTPNDCDNTRTPTLAELAADIDLQCYFDQGDPSVNRMQEILAVFDMVESRHNSSGPNVGKNSFYDSFIDEVKKF